MKKLTRNIIKREYMSPTLRTMVFGYSRAEDMMLGCYFPQVAHQISHKSYTIINSPQGQSSCSPYHPLNSDSPDSFFLLHCDMIKQLSIIYCIQLEIVQKISFRDQYYMGATCGHEPGQSQFGVFNPIDLDFKRVQPVTIPPGINSSLNAIKSIAYFPDPRQNVGLKWYHSLKYQLYLLGDIQNKKPIGECLFYLKNSVPNEELPVIIATKIQQKNIYSPNTLLLYSDRSYYLGTILSNGVEPPIANGKGTLVTKKFIYQGEFKNGYPDGYGTFKTKGGVLVGQFKRGQPHGKCVERTKKGLFIGELVAKFRKNGKLITPENTINFVNQQYNSSGLTMVEF